jgi:hypothetical protein
MFAAVGRVIPRNVAGEPRCNLVDGRANTFIGKYGENLRSEEMPFP